MMNWKKFCRNITAYLMLRTPLRSFGELVLRPLTIAERKAGADIAFSAAHNKQ